MTAPGIAAVATAKKPPGSGPGGASSGSSGKRRIVRTAAGARRYGVPIGSEIRPARNKTSKRYQNHKPSRQRYQALVGRDPKLQAAALGKLNRTQLQRLTALAWSFKSKDPNVTALRTGLTRELARRGINVRTYLRDAGVRTQRETDEAEARVRARRKPRPAPSPRRKPKPKQGGRGRSSGAAVSVRRPRPPLPKRKPVRRRKLPSRVGTRSAMTARVNDRRLQLSTVAQLRTVQKAFAKVDPQHRERAARFIVQKAVELSAVHVLSQAVVEASKVDPNSELGQQVIELAGRWKHGWIPLDATAMASKMKGGRGKAWWSGGKTKLRGNKSSLRRSIAAGNKNRSGGLKSNTDRLGTEQGEKNLQRRAAAGDREAMGVLAGRYRANRQHDRDVEEAARRKRIADNPHLIPGGGRSKRDTGPSSMLTLPGGERITRAQYEAEVRSGKRKSRTQAGDQVSYNGQKWFIDVKPTKGAKTVKLRDGKGNVTTAPSAQVTRTVTRKPLMDPINWPTGTNRTNVVKSKGNAPTSPGGTMNTPSKPRSVKVSDVAAKPGTRQETLQKAAKETYQQGAAPKGKPVRSKTIAQLVRDATSASPEGRAAEKELQRRAAGGDRAALAALEARNSGKV